MSYSSAPAAPSRFARRLVRTLAAAAAAVAACAVLPSCSKPAEEPAEVVKFSADDVASLLGIKGKDGIKVGDVESGRDGVKVKSISFKGGDETEVEVSDLDLRIASTGKLAYAVTSLKVAKIDVLDWATNRRAQAFDVQVDKPGPGFLSKLESAVSSARSGGPLRTAGLSCARLSIARITYVVRAADASLTKVNVEDVSIVDANADLLGEFNVGRAGLGDQVTGRGLKLTRIDRQWADQLLALLTRSGPGAAGAPTTAPAAAAPATPPIAGSPKIDRRVLPFDHLEVAEIDLGLDKLLDLKATVRITGLRLDVRRTPDGGFAGVAGSADLAVPTDTFPAEVQQFLRDAGGPSLDRSLAGKLTIDLASDPARREERTNLTLVAPALATVSLSGTTRHLPEAIAALLTQQDVPADYVTLSTVAIEARDGGLLAYVLSDRFVKSGDVRSLADDLAVLLCKKGEEDRARAEVAAFAKSPGTITWTVRRDDFVTLYAFFDELPKKTDAMTLKFTPKAPAAAPLSAR